MKGLLKRDFLIITKKVGKIRRVLMIALILGLIIALKEVAAISLALFLPLLCVAFPTTLLVEDEKCQWDKIVLAFPLNKAMVVSSRYIFCVVSIIAASTFSFLIGVGLFALKSMDIGMIVLINMVGMFVAITYILLVIPFNYALGINGGSYVMIVLLVVSGIVMGYVRLYQIDFLEFFSMPIAIYIAVGIMFLGILGTVSRYISLKICDKKWR